MHVTIETSYSFLSFFFFFFFCCCCCCFFCFLLLLFLLFFFCFFVFFFFFFFYENGHKMIRTWNEYITHVMWQKHFCLCEQQRFVWAWFVKKKGNGVFLEFRWPHCLSEVLPRILYRQMNISLSRETKNLDLSPSLSDNAVFSAILSVNGNLWSNTTHPLLPDVSDTLQYNAVQTNKQTNKQTKTKNKKKEIHCFEERTSFITTLFRYTLHQGKKEMYFDIYFRRTFAFKLKFSCWQEKVSMGGYIFRNIP